MRYMLDDDSVALAATAATAVTEATATEAWTSVRTLAAQLLSRGEERVQRKHLERLDRTATALRQSVDNSLPAKLEAAWQARFEDLLEDAANNSQRLELAAGLRRLVALSRPVHAVSSMPPSRVPYHGPALLAPPPPPDTAPRPGAAASSPSLLGKVPPEVEPLLPRAQLELLANLFDEASANWLLVGAPGAGKTSLAARVARHAWQSGTADLVVWVSAATRNAVFCDYAAAGAAITGADAGQPERSAHAFLAWLQATDRRWLVVLDGLTAPSDLHDLWPPDRPNGRVLVTARHGVSPPYGSRRVEVGPLEPGTAVELLARELADQGRAGDPAELAALAADLRHLPLVLSQAAACLTYSRLSCAAYRGRLRAVARPLPGESDGTAPSDLRLDMLAACWQVSIDTADLASADLARPLLELAGVLDPYGVPVAALTSRAALAYMARRRAGDGAGTTDDGQPIEPVGVRNAMGALEVLCRLRLVARDGDMPHTTVRVNTMLQAAVRRATPPGTRETLLRSAGEALREAWRSASSDPGSFLCRSLRSSTDALSTHAGEVLWQPQCHPVLFQYGRNLMAAGFIRTARTHWESLRATLDSRFGPDHPDTLAARGHLASVHGASQDTASAVAAYRELLSDLQRVVGPDQTAVFTVRDNLAHWIGEGGDPAGAAAAYAALLGDRLRVLGPVHRDTLLTRHNIALWRGRAGDAAGAATAYADLLDDMVRVFGPEDAAVLRTRDQLADWRNRAADAVMTTGTPGPVTPSREQSARAPRDPARSSLVRPSDEVSNTTLSSGRLVRELPWKRRLLRRLAAKGRSSTAVERQRGADIIRTPLARCHRIAVISMKGGTGKTTTVAALGATLAGLRDDRVIAIDTSPNGGTLARRVCRETGSTVGDLLAALPGLRGHEDVLRFMSPGPNGLEVLAQDVVPALPTRFGEEQYRQVVGMLSHAYSIVITDSGTGLLHETMRGVLALADQLVVVTTSSVDGAAVADATLDWLSAHGHAELARNSVVVLSGMHDGASMVRTDRITEHFAHRCRDVIAVPFDEHLATGAELDLADMRAETRDAYLDLAVLLAADFRPDQGGARRELASDVPAAPRRITAWHSGRRLANPKAPPRADQEPSAPRAAAASTGRRAPVPRTPLRPRLTVADDVVRVGAPTTIEFRLSAIDPWETGTAAAARVLVSATPRSAATLEPPVVSCSTGAEPAGFTFTAWQGGAHPLRFTVYDQEYGTVLQEVETTLTVPLPEPLGRP